jgi:LacI family transcriptional regulator
MSERLLLQLVPTGKASDAEVVRGVSAYALERGWEVLLRYTDQATQIEALGKLRGVFGVIADTPDQAVFEQFRRHGIPVLPMREIRYADPPVGSDNLAVGRLAFEHLWQQGHRRFAFCGIPRAGFSRQRQAGFLNAIQEAGLPLRVYPRIALYEDYWQQLRGGHLKDWLMALRKPVGLFAANENYGREVLAAAKDAGLAVPEEIAIICGDNDDTLCEMTRPSLTGIELGKDRLGYEAARLLDQLLAGEALPDQQITLLPIGVVPRQSTESLAIEDELVASALSLIRQQAVQGLTVQQILDELNTSRRTLEQRFKHVAGRTLHAEILRVRIEYARRLIRESDLPILDIALRCGFENVQRFYAAFRRFVGHTPTQVRRRDRLR